MTLISTQALTGSSITFPGILSGFSRLLLDLDGMSFAANNGQLRYEYFDGTNWSPVSPAGGATAAASVAQSGRIEFETPDADAGIVRGVYGALPASGQATANSMSAVRLCAGGIQGLRISGWSGTTATTFDAGTATLSGE